MIVLDTHVWVWWVAQDTHLAPALRQAILMHMGGGLGVSVISCWEIAKKVEVGKLVLDRDVKTWLRTALAHSGIRLLDLSPDIAVESTRLPQPFHKDPADQIIVATSRILDAPLATADEKILSYPHVKIL